MVMRWGEAWFTAMWVAGSGMMIAAWMLRLSAWWKNRTRRMVLFGPMADGSRKAPLRELPLLRRLIEEMEIAGIRAPAELMIGGMFFIGVIGWFAVNGSVVGLQQRFALDADRLIAVRPWLLNTAVAFLFGSLPYFYIKFRLQRKRHRIALDMIKLVQNLIGHYQNGRTVQEIITRSTPTMPEHVQGEWKRLEIGSHMQASLEEALYEFSRRADNGWAEDLADILLIKHKYGNNVIDALHKLVVDMQIARKNEEKRLAMVTVYRIGTSVMVLFAFFIVVFNVYADGTNYRHYFLNPSGKLLLFCSAFVLFVSMVLVVRSGRRTF
jgi:hypothetical protein